MIVYKPDRFLTANFQMQEFLVSASHPEMVSGIELLEEEIQNYLWLCSFCLQPVRDKFGPVTITSGYRPKILNLAIGGIVNSQHMDGEAADFQCKDMHEAYEYIVNGLDWPGQIFLFEKKKYIHLALPRVGWDRKHKIVT